MGTPDHPRACGENYSKRLKISHRFGSPPRMRGKQEYTVEGLLARRITPAHAGKTDKAGYGLAQWTDHPRACGENYSKRLKISHRFGSPPRMRGKQNIKEQEDFYRRITPAHAGKTDQKVCRGMRRADHPRACGENTWSNILRVLDNGSPPRMRGKPSETFADGNTIRITPAHAGKTPAHRLCKSLRTDHPRACGENKNFPLQFLVAVGSPPRMRGKLRLFVNDSDGIRITPAHAGKTFGITKITGLESDHPRACGENASNAINSAVGFGSPPRMRGKPSHLLFSSRSRRITPAHAGKTGGSVRSCLSISDHPRACGENFFIKRLTFFPGGSPPRMRGKPNSARAVSLCVRITPAHAGKTSNKSSSSAVVAGSPPRMRGKRIVNASILIVVRITPAHAGKTSGRTKGTGGGADHPRACGENIYVSQRDC